MPETAPYTPPPHEALTFKVDSIGDSQGIEPGDLVFEAKRTTESILGAHMEKYDDYVDAAQNFVGNTLGMVDVRSSDRVAVLSSETAESWGVGSNGGHYLPELDIAYVFE